VKFFVAKSCWESLPIHLSVPTIAVSNGYVLILAIGQRYKKKLA
jgi:hypothetical protein